MLLQAAVRTVQDAQLERRLAHQRRQIKGKNETQYERGSIPDHRDFKHSLYAVSRLDTDVLISNSITRAFPLRPISRLSSGSARSLSTEVAIPSMSCGS